MVDDEVLLEERRQYLEYWQCTPPIDIEKFRIILSDTPDEKASAQLKQLYEIDQAIRSDWQTLTEEDINKVIIQDRQHREIVLRLVQERRLSTAEDCYHAAMIFQHGDCPEYYLLSHKLCEQAIEMGDTRSKWLFAASYDRYLMSKGERQKYGTQYVQYEGQYVLYPVDVTTGDEEHTRYDVPSLAEAHAQADLYNQMPSGEE